MALTPYALEQCLNFSFTADAVVRPIALYFAWHSGPPGDDGSANELTVGVDADYTRQPITFASSVWSAITKKQLALNTNTVSIIPAAATSYSIYGFSIWDSLTGGNCLVSGDAKSVLAVSDVSPQVFVAGKIPVTLSRKDSFGRTSYGAALFLDWLLTADALTRPTALYLSVHTADPGDTGTANEITTGDDPDYIRQLSGFDSAATLVGGDTYTRNNIAGIWVPGTGANLTAAYSGIWDAATAGNCLYTGALSPSRQYIDGQTFSIAAKDFTLIEKV